MPFQSQVYALQSPALEGDFATINPRFTVLAGPGALVGGVNGVTVGCFCWLNNVQQDWDGAPAYVDPTGSGPVAGFVGREQQALIEPYLAEWGMTIPAGFPVTVYNGGDFWVHNYGSGAVTLGQKAFATLANGQPQFGAAGGTVTGAVETKWIAMTTGAAGSLIKISSWPLG